MQRSAPFIRRALLCIHELFDRSERRPISVRSKPSLRAASRLPARSSRRPASSTSTGGASLTRLPFVRSRLTRFGFSGPRSIPWAARLTLPMSRLCEERRRP